MNVVAVRIKDGARGRRVTVYGSRGKNRKVMAVINGDGKDRAALTAEVEQVQLNQAAQATP